MLFISYSTRQGGKRYAGELKQELESAFLPCFLAHEDIQESEDWVKGILRRLCECSAFLGIIDSEFNKSPFCLQELGAALASNKPMVLISRTRSSHPIGLASWMQSTKRHRVLTVLRKQPRFREMRVSAYIHGVETAADYKPANHIHTTFGSEWETMTLEERFRWLAAAATNSQVYGEVYKIGPFFELKCVELKRQFPNGWLTENDSDGRIRKVLRNHAPPLVAPQPKALSRRQQMAAI